MWVATAITTWAFASGCSTTATEKPHPASSSPTVRDPATATSQAILAGYDGMWEDFTHDGLAANWQDAALAHHATGTALLHLNQSLFLINHLGEVARGTPALNPRVTVLTPSATSPNEAEVTDCVDMTDYQDYAASTGKLVNTGPSGKHRVIAKLVIKDAAWKVSELTINGVSSC
ncbi:hypothetical protein [Catenulispora pinisilvae]|uniref:hypothetical protein n=1 Tax=Catenulispora pinisilvae TaxID=2705253 RepID=UPI001891DA4E|nr:hypothetical protein [Catenulispora pinisilvae]